MKTTFLQLMPSLTTARSYSATLLYDPCRRQSTTWLLAAVLFSLSSPGWAQCFTTSTVTAASPNIFPVGTNLQSVGVVYINFHDYPNLVVANYGSNTVSVLLDNGRGALGQPPTSRSGVGPFRWPWGTSTRIADPTW